MLDVTHCTWEDCSEFAQFEQKSSDGEVWAKLCSVHNSRFGVDHDNLDPKGLLRDWIKAQGGSGAVSDRISKQVLGE